MTATNRRPAFSLIELLIASGVGAVLLGLLLSAVQKARAVEARTRCENNLKKLGEGVQAYASAHDGVLPNNGTIQPVAGSDPVMNNIVTPYYGWNVLLLPYVGHEKTWKAIDLRYDWLDVKDSKNAVACSTRIPEFICPAAPSPDRVVKTHDNNGGTFDAGVTDYCGVPAAYSHNNNQNNLHAGAMNYRYGSHQVRMKDVGDGASNTMIVCEMGDKPNHWRAGKLVADNSKNVHTTTGIGAGQWGAPNWNHIRSFTFDGTQAFGECAVNCSNGAGIYAFHEGGANTLFVDGSVRFLSHTKTTQALLIALVTTNGGEVLADGDF